jgi:hypothetical protein
MVEELFPTISLNFIHLQTCDIKFFTTVIKEPLLTGKAQYSLSPCQDSSFCRKKNIFKVLKAAGTSKYKEANCTKPSLSVGLPESTIGWWKNLFQQFH